MSENTETENPEFDLITHINNLLIKVESPADLAQISNKAGQLGSELGARLKKSALDTALAALRGGGLTVDDLVIHQSLSPPQKERPPKRAVKSGAGNGENKVWRNPDNPKQFWTGRGRKPAWLVDKISKGASPEELCQHPS